MSLGAQPARSLRRLLPLWPAAGERRSPSDDPNAPVWAGRGPHYEVWYLTLNDPDSGAGVWIRYTLNAALNEPAQARLWFSSFIVDGRGGEVARAMEQPRLAGPPAAGPLALDWPAGSLRADRATGRMTTAEGPVEWDLSWTRGPQPPHSLISPLLQPLAHSLGRGAVVVAPAARFSGTLRIGQRRLTLRDAPGCQAHHWGRRPWGRWTWFRCSAFAGEPDATLEGLLTSWPSHGGLPSGVCAATLRWRGEEIRFDGAEALLRNRVEQRAEGLWVSLRAGRWRLRGPVISPPGQRVVAQYGSPARPLFCHNSEVAQATLTLAQRERSGERWRALAQLEAPGTFHWEVASPREDARVRRRVLPAP